MNFGDAVAGGIAAVGGTMEKIGLDGVRSAIEESRAARLAELSSQIRMRDEQTSSDRRWQEDKDRAPEKNRMAAESTKSKAEADVAALESTQGTRQALAASDSAAKLGVEENERPRRQGLIDASKADALKWEKENAADVNAIARGRAQATHIDDGAGLRAIQVKTAQLAYERAVEEKKIPVAVAKSFDAAKSQYHDLLTISSKTDFDPASETGKRILSEQAAVSKRMTDLMKPYLPEGMKEEKKADGPAVKYDKDGKAWTKDASGKVVPYAEKKSDSARTEKPAEQTAKATESAPTITNMERAGSGLMGGKKFVATYSDGTKKIVSGDDAERQFILMSK